MVRRLWCVCFCAIMLVGGAPSAHAAEWRPPLPEPAVLLAYGAEYGGHVHRGTDLTGAGGETVCSPAEGTVVFAGNVPADGGGTCGAVTIETAEGLRISLLPLERVAIGSGASIGAGGEVGILAQSGDDSSDAPHLHVGVRRGDVYLDPAAYLPLAVVQPSAPFDAPAPEAAPPVTPSAPVATPAPAAAVPALVVQPATSPSPAVVAAPAVAPVEVVTEVAQAVDPVVTRGEQQDSPDGASDGSTPRTAGAMPRVWLPPVRHVTSALLLLGMTGTAMAIMRRQRVACSIR